MLRVLIVFLFLFTAHAARAEERSLFRTRLHGNLPAFLSSDRQPAALKISFASPEGFHSYTLRKVRLSSSGVLPASQFFRGRPEAHGKRSIALNDAALDIYDGIIRIYVLSKRQGRPLRIEANVADAALPGGIPAKVYMSPRASSALCAQESLDAPPRNSGAAAPVTQRAVLGETRTIRLTARADYDFYVALKRRREAASRTVQRAHHEMASILNAANAIYMSQLGLEIDVTNFLVTTSASRAFNSTNSETVLRRFRSQTISGSLLGSADVYHLFSGIRYNGSVVGLAYLGALCQDPGSSYSFGLTGKASNAIRAFVTAHEIGHNMNASHVNQPHSIMSTVLTSGSDTFVADSINEISEYLAQFGSCLGYPSAPQKKQ